MDNSETTKSDRLAELELYEYRERLHIKMSLENKQNALIRYINFLLKQPLLNDAIDLIVHTTAFTIPSVENIKVLRELVSRLKEKHKKLKDEYKRRLFPEVYQNFENAVVEIRSEEKIDEDTEINRLINVKNELLKKNIENVDTIEELHQRRGGHFKKLLDRRNELVTKINEILRYTSFDNENDIYIERYSSTVTNFSLENWDNLRKSISRFNIKLTELEYVEKKPSVFV